MCVIAESRTAGSSTPAKTIRESASTAIALSCTPLPDVDARSRTGCASSRSLHDNNSANTKATVVGQVVDEQQCSLGGTIEIMDV